MGLLPNLAKVSRSSLGRFAVHGGHTEGCHRPILAGKSHLSLHPKTEMEIPSCASFFSCEAMWL